MVRGIKDGTIEISEVLSEETIQEVARIMKETNESIGELHNSQNGKYTHGLLRMVHSHLERKHNENNKYGSRFPGKETTPNRPESISAIFWIFLVVIRNILKISSSD